MRCQVSWGQCFRTQLSVSCIQALGVPRHRLPPRTEQEAGIPQNWNWASERHNLLWLCSSSAMPLTRSATRAAAISNGQLVDLQKHKADESTPRSSKRARKSSIDEKQSKVKLDVRAEKPMLEQMVPAALTFSFEEGRKHLISVDGRFEKLFNKMPCKPFEHLETVHPFRYEAWFVVCTC